MSTDSPKRRRLLQGADVVGANGVSNSSNPTSRSVSNPISNDSKNSSYRLNVKSGKRHGYDWYENVLGGPKFICGPMVDQSELSYRLLCLDHGTDLCYTPMINSKMLMQTVDSSLYDEFCREDNTWDMKRYLKHDEEGTEYQKSTLNSWLNKLEQNTSYNREWVAYNEIESADPNTGVVEDTTELPYFVKDCNNNAEEDENLTTSLTTISSCRRPVLNKFLDREFSTSERERGKVIAQFCGDKPQVVLGGARLIERYVDGIDLNCGCPQGIAKKGHYGSYLLEEPDLICNIIRTLHKGLETIPATVKIRKVNNSKTYQETLNLVEGLLHAGASALTIHGRTKEEKGQHVKEPDWEVAKLIKDKIGNRSADHKIPVFCNGGIENFSQAMRCLDFTGCDAVMSAEALLEDPQLFNPRACSGMGLPQSIVSSQSERLVQDVVFEQYMNYARKCDTRLKIVKAHAFHMMYAGLQTFTDLRAKVGQAQSIDDIEQAVCGIGNADSSIRAKRLKFESDLAEGRTMELVDTTPTAASEIVADPPSEVQEAAVSQKFPNLGWYRRYRNPIGGKRKETKEG